MDRSPQRVAIKRRPWILWLIITVFLGMVIGNQLGEKYLASAPNQWQVITCDVGQGSASLIRTDDTSAILVDAGDNLDKLEDCLKWAQVTTLTAIFLTHEHEDHVLALKSIKDFRDTPVYVSNVFDLSELPTQYTNIQRQLQGQTTLFSGDRCTVEGNTLSPSGSTAHLETSYNDDSLIELFSITCGNSQNLTYLATGDLEKPGVQKLLSENLDVRVDVLAVPHHGSKGAGTSLLQAAHPQLALISAGKNNEYGHPHREITEFLTHQNVPTLSTIESGHIAIYTEEGKILSASSRSH